MTTVMDEIPCTWGGEPQVSARIPIDLDFGSLAISMLGYVVGADTVLRESYMNALKPK